jgi:hypothetical protein
LDRNLPSSDVTILGINEFGQDAFGGVPNAANLEAANGRDIPLLQDTDDNQDGESDTWASAASFRGITSAQLYRDVWVVDSDGALQDSTTNLTSSTQNESLELQENYNALRAKIISVATAGREQDPAIPWQNAKEPLDVNNDGFVSAVGDVLPLISWFNTQGLGALPTPSAEITNYLDVTGNNSALASDAFAIIRHINLSSITNMDEAAAEPSPAAAAAALVDFDLNAPNADNAIWEELATEPAGTGVEAVGEAEPVAESGCPGHVEATDHLFASALDVDDDEEAAPLF